MARLGSLDAWLDGTARRAEGAPPPAVCFSSCFPFLDEIGFVVPPRTVWPPVSRALVSARVRWKSARFVPLGVVQAILAGQRLDENHWSVDGPSECLVPAGQPGPFRTGVRWSAAVDRLTGSTERHSTACIEFRPGAGLWTIVSFADADAHTRWLEPIKAAFRLLADTGFGGERSRGWGRSESPEFIDGILPDMILPPPEPVAQPVNQPVEQPAEQPVGQVTDLPSAVEAEQISAPPAPVGEQPAANPISEPTAPSAEGLAAVGRWGPRPAPAKRRSRWLPNSPTPHRPAIRAKVRPPKLLHRRKVRNPSHLQLSGRRNCRPSRSPPLPRILRTHRGEGRRESAVRTRTAGFRSVVASPGRTGTPGLRPDPARPGSHTVHLRTNPAASRARASSRLGFRTSEYRDASES